MSDEAKAKIEKALKILKEKSVVDNISFLINAYYNECPGIVIDTPKNISFELMEQLKINKTDKVDKVLSFSRDGNKLDIFICDMHFGTYPGGGDYNLGNLYVLYNGDFVLQNSVSHDYDMYGGSYKISFYEFTIKKLKIGGWLDELICLRLMIEKHKEQIRISEKNEALLKTSSVIDLGDL